MEQIVDVILSELNITVSTFIDEDNNKWYAFNGMVEKCAQLRSSTSRANFKATLRENWNCVTTTNPTHEGRGRRSEYLDAETAFACLQFCSRHNADLCGVIAEQFLYLYSDSNDSNGRTDAEELVEENAFTAYYDSVD